MSLTLSGPLLKILPTFRSPLEADPNFPVPSWSFPPHSGLLLKITTPSPFSGPALRLCMKCKYQVGILIHFYWHVIVKKYTCVANRVLFIVFALLIIIIMSLPGDLGNWLWSLKTENGKGPQSLAMSAIEHTPWLYNKVIRL